MTATADRSATPTRPDPITSAAAALPVRIPAQHGSAELVPPPVPLPVPVPATALFAPAPPPVGAPRTQQQPAPSQPGPSVRDAWIRLALSVGALAAMIAAAVAYAVQVAL
jgi:hypothetical protein